MAFGALKRTFSLGMASERKPLYERTSSLSFSLRNCNQDGIGNSLVGNNHLFSGNISSTDAKKMFEYDRLALDVAEQFGKSSLHSPRSNSFYEAASPRSTFEDGSVKFKLKKFDDFLKMSKKVLTISGLNLRHSKKKLQRLRPKLGLGLGLGLKKVELGLRPRLRSRLFRHRKPCFTRILSIYDQRFTFSMNLTFCNENIEQISNFLLVLSKRGK